MTQPRIYLSPPDVGEEERKALLEAFDSGWIAPVGPHLHQFERSLADMCGVQHAVALSSGTAALHLALRESGVGPGDRVYCSTLTFVASANAIRYCGAEPVFIDCDKASWCLDPELLRAQLQKDDARGTLPKAIEVVDIYGQCADWESITAIAGEFGVTLIEDASESLGATCGNRYSGSFGWAAAFSFNGNKLATTSGGGALVTDDEALATRVRHLATQAREPDRGYLHREMGYNYRLSNLLAGMGLAQLRRTGGMIARRRAIFERYQKALGELPGLTFMPEAPWGQNVRWLTVVELGADAPTTADKLIAALEAENIEARPVWRPMHRQPLYTNCEYANNGVADRLAERGVCLPSGSGMSEEQQDRVIESVLQSWA
ncbi:MAG: DegT/DnrJ/EryC1/StrS family aminotransferase [Puniceicoccales bacterium]